MVTTRTGNYVTEKETAHMTATTKLLNVVDDIPMVLQWQTIQATFKNYDFLSRCSHSSMPIDQTVYEEVNGYDWMLVNGLYKPHHTVCTRSGALSMPPPTATLASRCRTSARPMGMPRMAFTTSRRVR